MVIRIKPRAMDQVIQDADSPLTNTTYHFLQLSLYIYLYLSPNSSPMPPTPSPCPSDNPIVFLRRLSPPCLDYDTLENPVTWVALTIQPSSMTIPPYPLSSRPRPGHPAHINKGVSIARDWRKEEGTQPAGMASLSYVCFTLLLFQTYQYNKIMRHIYYC